MSDAAAIRLQQIWWDEDVIQLRAAVWNGEFGGVTQLYEGRCNGLGKHADDLTGFPRTVSDVRSLTIGTLDPKMAGGGVALRFYCLDRAGHAYVECRIRTEGPFAGVEQSAVAVMAIEAAAIDTFVEELRKLDALKDETATLWGKPLARTRPPVFSCSWSK